MRLPLINFSVGALRLRGRWNERERRPRNNNNTNEIIATISKKKKIKKNYESFSLRIMFVV